jgi:AAHS family benzoate transporter-like MFS transporter
VKEINVNKWIDDSKLNGFHIVIVLICLAIIMSDGYDLFVYGSTVPLLLKAFHIGPALAGILGSCALFGATIGALLFGTLADKIGRKVTIVCCASIFCVFMGLTGFTSSPAMFGLCRLIAGVGIGGSLPNVVTLASEYMPVRNRAWGVAAIMSGMVLGGVVAAGICMWLLPMFGWRAAYFVGAVPLLIMPVAIKWLPESPLRLTAKNRLGELRTFLLKLRPLESLAADSTFEINKGSGRAPIVDLFRERRGFSTVLMWLLYFMSFYIVYGLGVWLPKLMMNKGFPLSSGLWFLLVLNLGAFFASHIAGFLADRFGSKATIVVCFLITFFSIALMSYAGGFVALTILAALAGAGNNAGQNVAHGYVSTFYPAPMRSTAMGFVFGIGRFGAIFGPVIGGVLLGLKMPLTANFMALAVPGLIAALFISLVQDKYSFSYLSRQAASMQADVTRA